MHVAHDAHNQHCSSILMQEGINPMLNLDANFIEVQLILVLPSPALTGAEVNL